MQEAKIIFWFFLLFISLTPCLVKQSFLSLENYQNGLKGVFAKHPFRQKIPWQKSCPNKQSLKYLTQNKTKRVNLKTLIQPW